MSTWGVFSDLEVNIISSGDTSVSLIQQLKYAEGNGPLPYSFPSHWLSSGSCFSPESFLSSEKWTTLLVSASNSCSGNLPCSSRTESPPEFCQCILPHPLESGVSFLHLRPECGISEIADRVLYGWPFSDTQTWHDPKSRLCALPASLPPVNKYGKSFVMTAVSLSQ